MFLEFFFLDFGFVILKFYVLGRVGKVFRCYCCGEVVLRWGFSSGVLG